MNLKNIKNWNCYILNNMISKSKSKHPIAKDNHLDTKVIYWGIGKDNLELVKYVLDYIEKNSVIDKNTSYIIIAYEVSDWNDYFSPWEYVMNDNNIFNGYGNKTLRWISDSFNIIEDMYDINCSAENRYIIGYSLSGLFSLWAFYESRFFGGAASCSGSLWFPGWKEFIDNNDGIQENSKVYLSLGKKEEKTSNIVMKKVGEITRWQFDVINSSNMINKAEFQWHDGGHFHKIEKRIIAGIEWLLDN